MASLDGVLAEVRSLPENIRPTFTRIFTSLLKTLRFGHPDADLMAAGRNPLENFSGGFFRVTTPATPDEEFSIPHGMGRTPYLLIPVLPLDAVNATLSPLTVTRAADDKRIYLSSSDASATLTVLVEG